MAKKRTLTDVSLARSLAVEALATVRDYRDILKTPLAEAIDPLYRDVIALHNSLTPRQRKVLAAFARQGSSGLVRYGSVDFELTLRGGKKRLNGGLQDFFLGGIERSERLAGR